MKKTDLVYLTTNSYKTRYGIKLPIKSGVYSGVIKRYYVGKVYEHGFPCTVIDLYLSLDVDYETVAMIRCRHYFSPNQNSPFQEFINSIKETFDIEKINFEEHRYVPMNFIIEVEKTSRGNEYAVLESYFPIKDVKNDD